MIVDRIEADYAVIENDDGSHFDIHLSKLPQNIKEGDVLYSEDETYTINQQKTDQRREYIKNLQNSLWKKDK